MKSSSKIALVTGGSRGIGKNIALKIAEKGLDVILTYHSKKEAADQVVKQIEELGQKAVAFQLDTSDTSNFSSFFKSI